MSKYKKILAIIIVIFLSCKNNKVENQNSQNKTQTKSTNSHKFSSEKIFIDVMPSEFYLDSLRKDMSEDEWDEIVFDNEYYKSLTSELLIKNNYKFLEKPAKDKWEFTLKNGKIQIVSSKNLENKWGYFIFNGNDSAFYYDGTDPEEDLKNKNL